MQMMKLCSHGIVIKPWEIAIIDNLPYSQRFKVKYLSTNVNILHPYLKYFELLCLSFSLSIAEVKWLLSKKEIDRAILRYLIVLTGYFHSRHSS